MDGTGTSQVAAGLTQAGVVTNNADVLRRLAAVGLSLAVWLSTQSAPLTHSHPDGDATDHHHPFEVHAHFEGHPTASRPLDESVVDHPDDNDRAVFVRLFVGVVTAGFDLPAAVPALFDVSKPGERRSLRALYGFHGHDPPSVPSRSPRAPPAFLS